mmetsp:Transcript_119645/g.333929  ORF Transcript_119645/g.333929 Transcript_119645/m.333929 type:complete len:241 (-) Transcript_119645:110-832(-)
MGGVCIRNPRGDEFGLLTERGELPGDRSKGSSPRSARHQAAPAHVTLHIYNVGTSGGAKRLNGLLRKLGTGVFHCGVEVFGGEWSYSDTMSGAGDAIFCSLPRCCEGHTYSESMMMGRTWVTEQEFAELINQLKKEWTVAQYDILTRNCCHFSDHLCHRLGVGAIPEWAKSLAKTGAAILSTGDKSIQAAREAVGQAVTIVCCSSPQDADLVEMVEVCRYDTEGGRRGARKGGSSTLIQL